VAGGLFRIFSTRSRTPSCKRDKTTIRWRGHGTHRASFMAFRQPAKAFEYSGITIFRVAGGRIAEVWVYADVPSLVSLLRAAHEAQEKAKSPAPHFSTTSPDLPRRFMQKFFGFGRLSLPNRLLRQPSERILSRLTSLRN